MSSRRQRSILLGGRCKQVSLYLHYCSNGFAVHSQCFRVNSHEWHCKDTLIATVLQKLRLNHICCKSLRPRVEFYCRGAVRHCAFETPVRLSHNIVVVCTRCRAPVLYLMKPQYPGSSYCPTTSGARPLNGNLPTSSPGRPYKWELSLQQFLNTLVAGC